MGKHILTEPMTGQDTLDYLAKNYGEPELVGLGTGDPAKTARRTLEIAYQYGISGQSVADGYYTVTCRKLRRGKYKVMYRVEDHTERSGKIGEEILGDRTVRVARTPKSRYSRALDEVRIIPAHKEQVMPPRGATKSRATKAAKVTEPEPEVEEELDDELDEDVDDEDLDDEDESEEDEDDESEDDEDDDDDDEDEDEEEGDDEDEEDEEEDDDEEDSDAVDYTPYATKAITPTMEDFAAWMNQEIFEPVGSSIEQCGAEDPVRLVAIAGTARMEFQRSQFNIDRREARKNEKAAAVAAAKAKAAKAPKTETPVKAVKGKAPVKAAAPVKGKAAAKPATPAKTPGTRSAATPPAKAAPAKGKATPAKAATGGRKVTRTKGVAPY